MMAEEDVQNNGLADNQPDAANNNGGGNGQEEEEKEEELVDPVVTQVLSNPMLLQTILKHVKIRDSSIKKLRLVCKSWNKLILTLPVPRICWMLNNCWVEGSWNHQVFINFCNTVDPKLARCIGLVSRRRLNTRPVPPVSAIRGIPDNLNGYLLESVGYVNLKYCMQRFSDEIHTVDLFKAYVKIDYVQVIHRLLQTNCPNLTSLRLSADSLPEVMDRRMRPQHVAQTWNTLNFSTLTTLIGGYIRFKRKLTSIRFELFECEGGSIPRSTNGPLHHLYQELIKAAPNLSGLWQDFIAFPDLSRLKDLKSLNFRIQLHRSDFNDVTGNLQVPFNLRGLTRMLTQISHSVAYLKLEVNHLYCNRPNNQDCVCRQRLGFVMPQMMKLSVFRCSDFDILFGNENGGNISSLLRVNKIGLGVNPDSLQVIEIGRNTNGHVPGVYSIITEICNIAANHGPFARNVDTVIINGISIFHSLQNLRLPFPAIENLVINKHFRSRNQPDVNGRNSNECQLAELLNVCQYLTLTSLTCTIPYPSQFSTLVTVLHNNIPYFEEGFLREMTINGTGTEMIMDLSHDEQTLGKFEQALLSMRNMGFVKFTNFPATFHMDVSDRLWSFIRTNKLPLQFIWT